MLTRRYLFGLRSGRIHCTRLCRYATKPPLCPKIASVNAPTDALGLPISPTWSVHDLISSYPSPTLSDPTLTRLHNLAALVPPKQGTPEFEQLRREMEDLVKLVEAVRMVPGDLSQEDNPPDGRVWAAGRGIALGGEPGERHDGNQLPPSGPELLKHAQRTNNGFYLVDSARTKA